MHKHHARSFSRRSASTTSVLKKSASICSPAACLPRQDRSNRQACRCTAALLSNDSSGSKTAIMRSISAFLDRQSSTPTSAPSAASGLRPSTESLATLAEKVFNLRRSHARALGPCCTASSFSCSAVTLSLTCQNITLTTVLKTNNNKSKIPTYQSERKDKQTLSFLKLLSRLNGWRSCFRQQFHQLSL